MVIAVAEEVDRALDEFAPNARAVSPRTPYVPTSGTCGDLRTGTRKAPDLLIRRPSHLLMWRSIGGGCRIAGASRLR